MMRPIEFNRVNGAVMDDWFGLFFKHYPTGEDDLPHSCPL